MTYKLTKIYIEEGKSSMVQVGESVTGDLRIVSDYATPNLAALPSDIKSGDSIMVGRGIKDFISTSPVKRLIQKTSQNWTIYTNTSVYHLDELKEKENTK